MRLNQIIKLASKAYPDDLVVRAFEGIKLAKMEGKGPEIGDGLAVFIAHELTETFEENESDSAQLQRAVSVIEIAKDQLDEVQEALQSARDRLG